MKTMSKLLALIVAMAMVLSLMPTAAFAVEESAADASAAVSQEENERQQEEAPEETDGQASNDAPEAEEEEQDADEPACEDGKGAVEAQDGTTLVEQVNNATDGSTITLTADASGGGLFIGPNRFGSTGLTIDFGGHTYTVTTPVGSTGTVNQALHFEQGNKITLQNGKIKINVTSNAPGFEMFMQNYGALTIDGMTLDGTGIAVAHYGNSFTGAWAVFNGTAKPQFNYNTAGASVIRNSTITMPGALGIDDNAAVTFEDDAVINVSAITTRGTDERYASANPTVTVENGAKFKLTDGSNATAFANLLAANGQSLGAAVNGVYTVTSAKIAEVWRDGNQIGSYDTLDAALTEASSNGTVKLLNDVRLSSRVDVNASGSVIIDLNGKTVTPTATCANGSAFNIQGGTVTITNGTLDGTLVKEVRTKDDNHKVLIADGICLVTVCDGATLTLSDITATINSKNGCCVYPFANGKVYITGGTYTNKTTEPYQYNANAKALLLNQANKSATQEQLIFVSGGIFQGYNPALGDETNPYVTTFLAEGCKSVDNGDGSWTVEQPLHTFNYSKPDVRWRVINGEMKAIFIYSCSYCDETQTEIVTPTSSDSGTTRTYTATDAHGNTKTLEKETGYTVTQDGDTKFTNCVWGQVCTLTADGAKKWFYNDNSGAHQMADATNTYVFAVTGNTNITTQETNETAQSAFVYATLKNVENATGQATFNAKWSIPTGTSVDSVTIYRGFTETDSSNITTDVLKSKGKPHNVNLLVWNGDYTLHLTELTKNFQYAMIEIVYTDSSGIQHSLPSGVQKIQVTSGSN